MSKSKKKKKVYFDGKLSHGFVSLFISKRLIQGLAIALMSVFLPIFLYETSGDSLSFVIGFFFLASITYVLTIPHAMKFFNYIGYRKALALAMFFNVIFYSILYVTDADNIMMLFAPLFITLLLFRLFHWVPYVVDLTLFTDKKNRGRELSLIFATVAFMGIIGPILAGYIIDTSGYQTLFAIVIVLLSLAGISYLFVPETNEKFTWSYFETWKQFAAPKHRMALISLAANGAETTFSIIVWPIFVYELVQGDLLQVGILSTLIVFVTIGIQLFLGRYIDKSSKKKRSFLQLGSFFDSVGWIAKIFVLSTTHIFVAGLYHNVTKIFTKTSYNTIIVDMTADQGHYADEFTVIREMAIHLGRAFALVVIGFMTLYLPLQWTFLLGAFAVLALNVANRAVRS